MKNSIICLVTALMMYACTTPEKPKEETVPGLDLSNMDLDVSPKEDFYRFANGKWLDKTEIPADEGRWGGFGELRKRNNKKVLAIMEASAENPEFKEGSDERKAVDFFSVGMDSMLAEKAGVQALKKWFDKIDALENRTDIQGVVADMHKNGYGGFHWESAYANMKDSKINSLYIGAGGLGLPNRDYYTKEDEKSKEIRAKYLIHLDKMFELSGIEGNTSGMADQVMNLETRLAEASLTPIERRNRLALYNPKTFEELQDLAPVFDWKAYFKSVNADITKVDSIIVRQPKFLTEMNSIVASLPMSDIQAYLKWNVVNQAANYLNNDIVQANFDFYSKIIRGTEKMKPRWDRVLVSTNSVIGEAIGKVYVAETFPPEAKANAEEMVGNLIKAFDQRIRNLEWMSEDTKTEALKKLNNFTVKIGYPDKWRDYADLTVESSGESYSYIANMEKAWAWQHNENIKEIAEPVDKARWGMNPQTVNAYFNPTNNEIVFPAAILQPPFYNYTADAAVNYGGIGAVIGHEISHGFDDQGSRFDWSGNMVNWWTEEDRTSFDARTEQLVAQFDAYEPLDSVNVQGKLTLGENIGDLGGLASAYDGLQIYLNENGHPGEIDGFTPEQRFFISWATIWRTKYRDETLRNQILTDPHSPGMFRAVGPLINVDEFYTAFDVKEGDPIFKAEAERVRIW
ncbi:MAG: putative endopeptidase [Cyclobacteriaceae bacterium]|jgi:putative endopeptidase